MDAACTQAGWAVACFVEHRQERRRRPSPAPKIWPWRTWPCGNSTMRGLHCTYVSSWKKMQRNHCPVTNAMSSGDKKKKTKIRIFSHDCNGQHHWKHKLMKNFSVHEFENIKTTSYNGHFVPLCIGHIINNLSHPKKIYGCKSEPVQEKENEKSW